MAGDKSVRKLKVVFLHPDLGIGGAERSMVDAAVCLKQSGHEVQFLTAHHDPTHCFPETKDGTLPVTVVGDWLPRSTFGRLFALWAYIRMIIASLYLITFSGMTYDVIVLDQVSACLPVLKVARAKVLFYCHFPDQLLTKRESILKKIYRAPIDWLEEKTTGMADVILVNSAFTAGVFKDTFRSLSHWEPEILYPIPNLTSLELPIPADRDQILPENKKILLSINRYERKKNLDLAIEATAYILKDHTDCLVHLVMAGGYDLRVAENVEYHEHLQKLAHHTGISNNITFLKSFTDDEKRLLLSRAECLLYTPENEHFGMVPVEAMFMGCPVVACDSGGPLETVLHGETGFHCRPTVEAFGSAAYQLLSNSALRSRMSKAARERVQNKFSLNAFSSQLNDVVHSLINS